MNALALNAGSGSLRYKLFARREGDGPTTESLLKERSFDRVQGRATVEAAEQAVADCLPVGIDAIGCRVVHGGGRFAGPARVTPEVLAAIRDLSDLAPLHNPTDVAVIEAATRRAPGVPSVAVFDTAFHRTVPEVAWRYALPAEAGTDLRRYGFHGIAHRHVSRELFRLLGRDPAGTRVVSCHLGGGASVCALWEGRSVDTSMGLTPRRDRPMVRLGTTTRRSPAEVVEKAITFFGPAGLGLDVRERGQDTATFAGAGGYVTVRASARADGSEITVEAREWDHDARRFVEGL